MDFFNEYYDVIFNGYYDFIIGSVVAFFIGKFFDVILCFFKKICYGIIGKKETDPSPTPIESIKISDTNIKTKTYQELSAIIKDNNIENFIYSPRIVAPEQTDKPKDTPTKDKEK